METTTHDPEGWPERPTTPEELNARLEGRRVIDVALMSELTGLVPNTIRNYASTDAMPATDARGIWFADREDVRAFILTPRPRRRKADT
jgi:hypothetical protein